MRLHTLREPIEFDFKRSKSGRLLLEISKSAFQPMSKVEQRGIVFEIMRAAYRHPNISDDEAIFAGAEFVTRCQGIDFGGCFEPFRDWLLGERFGDLNAKRKGCA